MSGTKAGAAKALQTNLSRNPNHFKDIGRVGGKIGRTGGFASKEVGLDGMTGRERARIVGALGGRKSVRKPRGN